MKKTFAIMTAVVVAAVFLTSCEKEGQYAPKQKISEIKHIRYHELPSGTTISNNEREVWTWNGKVLSYIDYYDAKEDRVAHTLFRYDDKNRITEINYGSTTAKFDYDDNVIDEIKVLDENGATIAKFDLEHKGNTVTSIDVTLNDGKSLTALPFNPLNFFMPEDAANKVMECSRAKGTTHVTLTWTGKNVTAMELSGAYNISYKWTYDGKNNPYKGLFDMNALDMGVIFSANNVVRQVLTEGGSTFTTDYTYTYDGKNCPVEKSWKSEIFLPEFEVSVPVKCVDEFHY